MSEEEAVKILQYKVNNVNKDVYIGELDKQNIEAINILLRYIEQLQHENKELKKQVEIKNSGFMASVEEVCKYATILIEFEKWLEEQIKYFDNRSKYEREDFEDGMKSSYLAAYKELQELKEGKK